MKIEYSVVAELDIRLDGTNELNISYFKDKQNIGNSVASKAYKPNKMEIDIIDVNTIRLGFNYVCNSDSEISLELLKLRVKNRLCQNLIVTNKNGLVKNIADKIKVMAIEDGYEPFMANALRLKFMEYSDADKMGELLKSIDNM